MLGGPLIVSFSAVLSLPGVCLAAKRKMKINDGGLCVCVWGGGGGVGVGRWAEGLLGGWLG